MSRKYKFKNPEGLYFISFATVGWIDVFTRNSYSDIVVESLQYCQKEKGLILFAWVIISNHIHLIAKAKEGYLLQHIMRDLFTNLTYLFRKSDPFRNTFASFGLNT